MENNTQVTPPVPQEGLKTTTEPVKIDFGKVFFKSFENKTETFSPITYAQSITELKKKNPETKFDFSDESFNQISEKYGKENAESAKKLYEESVRLSEYGDMHKIFASPRIQTLYTKINNIEAGGRDEPLESHVNEKAFWIGQSYKPFQHSSFEQAADQNRSYYKSVNGEYVKTELAEGENFDTVTKGLRNNGENGIVVATNEFMAKIDPVVAQKIKDGELHKDSYYEDENKDFVYRQLSKSELSIGQARSVMGPRTVYNEGLFSLAADGIYNGVLTFLDASKYVGYINERYVAGAYYSLLTGTDWDIISKEAQNSYNDYNNWSSALKSAGSMEEDKGWSYSFGNTVKQIGNGIGQILPTMGTGLFAKGGLKVLSSLVKTGAISPRAINLATGGFSRTLNFGVAAKAAKDEADRLGLSQNESDALSLVAGAIMLATEFATGSQFIPKITGTQAYKEVAGKMARHAIQKSRAQGIPIQEYLLDPVVKKGLLAKAHAWLDAPATGMFSGFAKGFVGEGIQEFSEDLGYSLVKEAYDYQTGTDTFDQTWDANNVWHDLLGSFVMGAFSGGIIKSVSSIGAKKYKNDQLDENRNNFYINAMVEYGLEDMIKAKNYLKKQGFASKHLSINKDKDGQPILLSKDKGLNAMSENDFFDKLFDEQIKFTKQSYDVLKTKSQSKQVLADNMTKYMDQIVENKLSITEVTKGTQMLMDIEGMQAFRQESLLMGHLLLEGAKARALGDAKNTIDSVEEIRLYGGKIFGIKRESQDDFTMPTVEEETLFQQVYNDIFQSNRFSDSYTVKAEAVRKAFKEMSLVQFKMERLKTLNAPSVVMGETIKELEERTKEHDELKQELIDDLKKDQYSPTMADTILDIAAVNEFKSEIFSGNRSKRYLRNFSLNLKKEGFPVIFKGRENYNVEDYDYDKRRREYFESSNQEVNEILQNAVNESSDFITQTLALTNDPANDVNAIINTLHTYISDPNVVLSPESKTAIIDFFEKNAIEFSSDQVANLVADVRSMAGLIGAFLNNLADVELTIEEEGAEAVLENYELNTSLDKTIELLKGYTPEQIAETIQLLKEKLLPEINDPANLQKANDIINSFPSMIAEALQDYNIYLLSLEFTGKKDLVSELKTFDSGNGPITNDGFVMNRNKAYSDNFVPGESQLEVKIKELEGLDDFIDSGIITELLGEIRRNQRYLIASISEANYQKRFNPTESQIDTVNDVESLKKLHALEQRLNKLREISDRNRGNRFNRDYQVTLDYINNSIAHIKAINTSLSLGLESQINEIRTDLEVDDSSKDAIHEEFVKLVKLENELAVRIQGLDDSQLETLFSKLSLTDIPNLLNTAYQQVNEDNDNPFQPESERDQIESMLSYILMLSRGGTEQFFTYAFDHFDDLDLDKKSAPSREQLIVARQVFSKLNQEGYSNAENFVAQKFKSNGKSLSQATIMLRGIAGAGKSTKVMNVALDVMARIRVDQGKTYNILYTAPKASQIANLGESINLIPEGIVSESFELSNPSDKILEKIQSGNMANVDVIVIDEATVFSGELNKIMQAVEAYNLKSGVRPIKVVLAGDDLQQAKKNQLMNFMYGHVISHFIERTTPLTTPFRNGKIDSFDIQMNHRKMIAILTKLLLMTHGPGKSILIPGQLSATPILTAEDKERAYKAIVDTFITPQSTKYYAQNGVVKKGIKAVASKAQVYTELLQDLSERNEFKDKDIAMITSPGNKGNLIFELKKLAGDLGIDVAHVDFDQVVIESDFAQGSEFDMVYTDIQLSDPSNSSGHFTSLKSLYVAESRERQGLVMITDGFISSVPVAIGEDIISFPPLDFNLRDDQNNLMQESLELINNNNEIKDLLEELAVKKVALPATTKTKSTMSTNNTASPSNTESETNPPENGNNDSLPEKGKGAAAGSIISDMDLMERVANMSLDELGEDDGNLDHLCK